MPQLLEHRQELVLPEGQGQELKATLGALGLALRWEGLGESPEVAMLALRWDGPYELTQLRDGTALPPGDREFTADGGVLLAVRTGPAADEVRFDPDGPSSHSLSMQAHWQPGGLALKLHEQAIRF